MISYTMYIYGISIALRLFLRLEWHITMFSCFCLDIEKVAVVVKCLLLITYVALKVVYENILMISPCGWTAAIIA